MSAVQASEPVLSIRDLSVALPGGGDRAHAIRDVGFEVRRGETLCIVGESGSGKSMTAHAVMGLLPQGLSVGAGEIRLAGQALTACSDREWRAIRGRSIGMIFQEPMTSLNPVQRIGEQIVEVFKAHGVLTPAQRRAKALALLAEVGLPEPEQLLRAFPHQLSGGQRQRVMIAMAVALEPHLLIADEPTTALDVTTQGQILKLIARLQRERGMSVLLITHDFGVVAEIADRVVVMHQGRVVESGVAGGVLERPQHAYTKALLASVPSLTPPPAATLEGQPIALSVEGLSKTYVSRASLFGAKRTVAAADEVSFTLRRGETLGIIGESGSGKSTVGKCLVRLLAADAGAIRLGEVDFLAQRGEALRTLRRKVQMIFQDPYASLNPRKSVGRIITDGPIAHGVARVEAERRAGELMELVGLGIDALKRYPHEFSGGQRQRIGIARALALDPDIIVADEAVSALDVSVQAQVLALLADLKRRMALSLVFITHDLRVAAQICDRVAIMQRGRIVEIGPTAAVFAAPEHAYTRELLAAVPGAVSRSVYATGSDEAKGR
ncbi:Glutathione import ATP-binding protein GsiA [Bosea sp. 62]|uniref:ABC transporter ATP-binding protein n=1 Tax=unclassified Bosea (in: a-proteobacteria) TaxID=2653178 RepID=UPI0012537EA5|nr:MULTISPECIES: ABC transporter ATP-binding protein [unclassified Bosea (in: a-proteobacteria)]CAD5251182.1 Glutathione import ATP-binding protein GsiA [Bosea sp. 7B]CAD5280929.1 Glutathione import ATP-binding protein GsiA [Bosea sp. 21B]CAD5282092.1 Glutathione import ATP-binding protein GsiA [Bosea sp. 46]VVT59371.1 Glutathione import ATP-binding protein GsiA [Bosea sp. EC-HK365B]VXB26237.1 Glutathione import ATP-binding protein GsiA [Bosea sp. 62]